MKNLYTITFDSDSTTEEEKEKNVVHTPIKPPRPANSNTKIRPLPRSPRIKITTRNLSEESRQQSYSLLIDSNSNFQKDNNQNDSSSENYEEEEEEYEKTRDHDSPVNQTNIRKCNSDEDSENEEIEIIKQNKTYSGPNLHHYHRNIVTPQTPNLKDIHLHSRIHHHSHKNAKSVSNADINDTSTDIDVNQNHNINPRNININIVADQNSSNVDVNNDANNVENTANKNEQNNNDNIKPNDAIKSNSAGSNLATSNNSFQQLNEPLHFTITRQNHTKRIFNKKNTFIFTDSDNNCLFEAKPEKGSLSNMNIYCGSHYDQISSQIPSNFNDSKNDSSNQFGVVICSPDLDSFSLRLNNQYGREVMSVRINSKKCKNSSNSVLTDHQKGTSRAEMNPNFDLNGKLRLLKVNFFFDGSKKNEKKLQNAESFGVPLDFGQRTVLQSTKNFILIDSYKQEFVAIRKIEKNRLCVDFQPTIPAFCAFAIGLVAFLYKA